MVWSFLISNSNIWNTPVSNFLWAFDLVPQVPWNLVACREYRKRLAWLLSGSLQSNPSPRCLIRYMLSSSSGCSPSVHSSCQASLRQLWDLSNSHSLIPAHHRLWDHLLYSSCCPHYCWLSLIKSRRDHFNVLWEPQQWNPSPVLSGSTVLTTVTVVFTRHWLTSECSHMGQVTERLK